MIIPPDQAANITKSADFDICVCGTGFAGLAVATDLARRGFRIALIEGGGTEWTESSQDLYSGKANVDPGMFYEGLETCRVRFFGGTSFHWTGACIPFDDIDFAKKNFSGLPGWPISKIEFDQFLPKAKDFLDITGQSFQWPHNPFWQSSSARRYRAAGSPPTRLFEKHFEDIVKSDKISLFLETNLVNVDISDNYENINHFNCVNNLKIPTNFKAKYFILACGAVENARILLNSNKKVSVGIGNTGDMVGRCFMEHLNGRVGRFFVESNEFWTYTGAFGLKPTEKFITETGLSNSSISYYPNRYPRTYGRLRLLKKYLRDAVCISDSMTELARIMTDFDCPSDGTIDMMAEQAPNLSSRVKLGNSLDRLGMRRVILDWRLSELDKKTFRDFAIETAKEMARQKLARVQLNPDLIDRNSDMELGGHCHQMGTTRMSADPAHGVVDADCRVHGVNNLFIAGSSVFPTGGANNPTMPLVQLSFRLADHLSSILR